MEEKKVMICQKMAGKTPEEIAAEREAAIEELKKLGYKEENIIKSWFKDEYENQEVPEGTVHPELHFGAKSIDAMSTVHAVYFCPGWKSGRWSKIEHKVAKQFELDILGADA